MTRNVRAIVGALVLTLALVTPAFAGTSNVTDSFTVNGTVTVTGIPATISYGALDDGTTSATQTIDASITANSNWTMKITGTDFARTGGGTLSKSVRQVLLSTIATGGGAPSFEVTPSPTAWQAFDAATLTNATPDVTGVPGASIPLRSELRIVLPGGTQSGAYQGTITYTFSAV